MGENFPSGSHSPLLPLESNRHTPLSFPDHKRELLGRFRTSTETSDTWSQQLEVVDDGGDFYCVLDIRLQILGTSTEVSCLRLGGGSCRIRVVLVTDQWLSSLGRKFCHTLEQVTVENHTVGIHVCSAHPGGS